MKARQYRVIWKVLVIVLLILAIAAIYPAWNGIWYDFGRNLYHVFHN